MTSNTPPGSPTCLRGRPAPEEPSTTPRPHQPEEQKGWHSRGYLPHLNGAGLLQHITFHLADSLPHSAIERMERELESVPENRRDIDKHRRIQELLDAGLGACILRQLDCARVVEQSLLFGDGDRYHLLAWVVMPNHVHVLLEQLPGWPLGKLVQSWKRHTTREIWKLGLAGITQSSARPSSCGSADCKSAIPRRLRPTQVLWQRDYWDRYIRNERHFVTAKKYIEDNPVMAGLAATPEAWPWGSARRAL